VIGEADKEAEYFGSLGKMKRWRIESGKLILEVGKDSL
jgi:hypothetical protein